MKITLYESALSPYVLKVKIVLFEKGVEFESKSVDLLGDGTKQPAFLAINPFHKVPVLRVGTAFLFESTAINEYLEEKYPKPPLLPVDLVLRAEARAWEEAGDLYFGQVLGGLVRQNFIRPGGPDPAVVEALRTEAAGYLTALDARLAGRDFVAALFSLADINLAVHVHTLRMLGVETDRFANIVRWLPSVTGRESFRRAEPSPEVVAEMMDHARKAR